MTDQLNGSYDVVVIGGGAAGLSAGLMLGRARRSVVVIDAGAPRNAPAEGVHGLFAREGMSPLELAERGQAEVRQYGGHVVSGEVTGADQDGDGFAVSLADGRTVRARRLLVTTGLIDELPDIEGLREQWGHGVVHCPYCHGWEVRDKAIGVLGNGPMAVHSALLWGQWSSDITLFTHSLPPLTDEQVEQLAARGVRVVDGEVAAIESAGEGVTGVRLADGTVVSREVVAAPSRMSARAGFLAALGLSAVDHPMGVGSNLAVDPMGRTEVPGVWAAGNVADLNAQVGSAAAAGAFAAAQINADLVTAEIAQAVEAKRAEAVSVG